MENIRLCGKKIPIGLSKLQSKCPVETFEENHFSEKFNFKKVFEL